MYKQHLIDNMERELQLIKKLIPHIEERDLDYRPADKTRSTIELMRYLSNIGSNMLRWFIIDDLTPEEWEKIRAERMTLTIANFGERIDMQMAAIRKYMDMISEQDLMSKEVTLPWKEKMILGSAIINCPVKWLAAYRLQLFLYLKMNGKSELGTKEAWVYEPAVPSAAQ